MLLVPGAATLRSRRRGDEALAMLPGAVGGSQEQAEASLWQLRSPRDPVCRSAWAVGVKAQAFDRGEIDTPGRLLLRLEEGHAELLLNASSLEDKGKLVAAVHALVRQMAQVRSALGEAHVASIAQANQRLTPGLPAGGEAEDDGDDDDDKTRPRSQLEIVVYRAEGLHNAEEGILAVGASDP